MNVDRWTFAREWVQQNASKYKYKPDRFNTFYYTYIVRLIHNPFRRFSRSSDDT